MNIIDDARVLYEHLAATGTGLYTLVGTRVYYGALPAEYDNTQAAIVYMRRGGQRDPHLPIAQGDWQFRFYGGTSDFKNAEAVYRAAAARLHGVENAASTTGAIVDATETGMGQAILDPQTRWPYIVSFYNINVRALAAA
jgi:poly(3-hydroxybutyrate) depolymerase